MKTSKLLGIISLVLIAFGLISYFLIEDESYQYLVSFHLALSLIFISIFFVRGGVSSLKSNSVARNVGFSLSLFAYSFLFVVCLVLVNYFAAKHSIFYFDSTEQKVFTFADKTKAVLKSLKEPVIVRAFYVGKIDAQVESLLNRFAKENSNFTWQLLDPEKNPVSMEQYGINQSATLHFSFANENIKKQAKIVKEINEQEITNALHKLVRSSEKVVYFLTGHGEGEITAAHENGYLFLSDAIVGENITIKSLNLSEQGSIPSDTSAIILLAPKKPLLELERQVIEDYLHRGGNAIFLGEPKYNLEIINLVRPLGINLGEDLVVDQILSKFTGPGLGIEPIISRYASHQITLAMRGETLFRTVSSVTKAVNIPAAAEVTELAYTSENSWAEKNLDKLFSEKPTATFEEEDVKGPVAIAASFEGIYPQGSFIRSGEVSTTTVIGKTNNKSRIVVIGDSEFINNTYINKVYNSDFFLNILNWTIGQGEEIIIASRNFRKTDRALSQEQFNQIFIYSCIIFPELLLIIGLTIWQIRRVAE